MTKFIEKVVQKKLSRRRFLAASAAGTAGLMLSDFSKVLTVRAEEGKAIPTDNNGKWVNGICWMNCGGGCKNEAYVVDNVILRQKTDTSHPDSPDFPQQRGCLRGRSQRKHIFGADRLKYPMKRKHWQPGGGDKSLRGKDEWERISWDEALKYVADELKRAKANHGARSILLPSWEAPKPFLGGDFFAALFAHGGCTTVDDPASWGAHMIAPMMGLPMRCEDTANDRFDMRKADTVVLIGCNPVWASPGSPSYHYWQAKKAGAKFVFVGPDYNPSANCLDARWIRVRPGTDTAFQLAVAYTMLTEDTPAKPIIDWDFLYKYTVGFDGDHMPDDATINENFRDYLFGEYDGQPKTAAWASEICGTPVEDIIWYAREMRRDKKVSIIHSFAASRCHNADDLPQLLFTVAAMGGHFGKAGHCCGDNRWTHSGNCGPKLVSADYFATLPPGDNPVDDVINGPDLWEAILTGKYRRIGQRENPNVTDDVQDRDIDIRVIIHSWRNSLQTNTGTMKGIEAHRKVDFVMSLSLSMNASAQYSDIVLPISSQWERFSPCFANQWINREVAFFGSQVLEPLYETKSDQQIGEELCRHLGIDPKTVYPDSEAQRYFNMIAASKVINKEGTAYETLVTITPEDLAEWGKKWGVKGKTQEGRIGIKELMEVGMYQVERYEGDPYGHVQYADFVQDPEKNPLPSKSGRFEIYCQTKADKINNMGYSTVKPYPTYVQPLFGYEQSFSNWEKKEKAEFRYQLFNPHYLRASHTTYDNNPWLREMMTVPAFINAQDAAEKGIKTGDTLLIYNQFGKILRRASVTETMMPGCMAIPQGSWFDLDEKTGIDHGGAENTLVGSVATGQGVSGYNTTLVNYEKYDGPALKPDYLRPLKIVEL